MEIDDIMAAIAALEPYERQQFESHYAAFKEGNQRELSRATQYVADAISEICRINLSPARWRKLGIDARSSEFYDWLGDQLTGLNETQIKGLVRVCLRVVAAYLRGAEDYRRAPVDPAALLEGLKLIGLAMDVAFPGYWESRILYRLVPRAEIVAG
jgi:hypothetical protein